MDNMSSLHKYYFTLPTIRRYSSTNHYLQYNSSTIYDQKINNAIRNNTRYSKYKYVMMNFDFDKLNFANFKISLMTNYIDSCFPY